MTNQYCIWYPSGGFGHFINAVLTLHAQGFARPNNQSYEFSPTGNSHALELVAPKYLHDQGHYEFGFDPDKRYSILIDNGITNQSKNFRRFFPGAAIIKICYDDMTWPIVARTAVEKAMGENLSEHLTGEAFEQAWPEDADWSRRERYFLYLRDHPHRYHWREDADCTNLQVSEILDHDVLRANLEELVELDDFRSLYDQWDHANQSYIAPVKRAAEVLERINDDWPLVGFDLWSQAVVNYYIWLKYQFEVPANDYADWFTNTQDIATMLKKHGIQP